MSNIYMFGFKDVGRLVRIRLRLGKFTGNIPTLDQLTQIRAPIGIEDGGVGSSIETTTLTAWARSGAFRMVAPVRDVGGVITGSSVVWPDLPPAFTPSIPGIAPFPSKNRGTSLMVRWVGKPL